MDDTKINEFIEMFSPEYFQDENGYHYYEDGPSALDEAAKNFQGEVMDIINKTLNGKLQEIIDENAQLKKEVTELRSSQNKAKYDSDKIIREYNNKLDKLDSEWLSNKRQVLFDEVGNTTIFYAVHRQSYQDDKCALCDSSRKITINKNGVEFTGNCLCGQWKNKYVITEYLGYLKEITQRLSNYSSDRKRYVSYSVKEVYHSKSYYRSYNEYNCKFDINEVYDSLDDINIEAMKTESYISAHLRNEADAIELVNILNNKLIKETND